MDGDAYREKRLGSSPHRRYTPTFAMVFPETLCHLSGLNASIDADGHRGLVVPLAVATDDHPSTIRPLHNLGMVDLPQRARLQLNAPL